MSAPPISIHMSADCNSQSAQNKTYGVIVGQEVKADPRTARELGDDAKGGQRGELVVAFERPLELLLGRADAEVVQYHVALYASCIMVSRRASRF